MLIPATGLLILAIVHMSPVSLGFGFLVIVLGFLLYYLLQQSKRFGWVDFVPYYQYSSLIPEQTHDTREYGSLSATSGSGSEWNTEIEKGVETDEVEAFTTGVSHASDDIRGLRPRGLSVDQ